MNHFVERFTNHPLHASIQTLQETYRSAKIEKPGDADPVTAENIKKARGTLARVIWVARFLISKVENTNPLLWTPATLKSLHTAVAMLTAAIAEYLGNRDAQAFFTASDTAIDHLGRALWSAQGMSHDDNGRAFEEFCARAEASLSSIDALENAIKGKEAEITSAKEAFTQKLSELGSQLETFKTQFEQQKLRVDDLVTSQQQAFQNAQTERATLFSQELENRKTTFATESEGRKVAFESWQETSTQKVEELLTKAETDSQANREQMEKHLERAKEILGIVAASGVSGHYKETAERDFESANNFRRLTLFFFVLMGAVVVYIVLGIHAADFRWEMGLFRMGVGMALLIPAYYCAKESTKHREAEKRNRRLQIELATLEPYLEKLHDGEEMRKILKEKAATYFVGQVHQEPDDDMDGQIAAKELRRREDQVMDLLKAIAGNLRKS
jgi:hypothetical protein